MARPLPLILLPPSEGKAPGGDGPAWSRGSMAVDLDRSRTKVMTALVAAMRGSEAERSRVLGVKGAALAAATAADRSVRLSPTMPAIERYTGVLYDALDHRSLPPAARRRLGSSVLIVSGLWGLVAPRDPIPDYKLKMGAQLPGLGRLSAWWREALTAALIERAQGRLVWDLLPNEHAAAWTPPGTLPRVTVRFLESTKDGSRTVSHANKALKGELVRHLVTTPSTTPDDLRSWRPASGFRLDPSLTEEHDGLVILSLVGAASGR